MKRLLKNGTVINVFLDLPEKQNVLMEDGTIIGVGEYTDADADIVENVSGKYICPGFIDGHIHIESSMLQPAEFARACLPHGTTAVVADPHEIANVAGRPGILYMMEASAGVPMTVYIMVPSCVPATPFDESGAVLHARDISAFYGMPQVLGLGEMMNYPGVLARDPEVEEKIAITRQAGKLINGHAPLLSGKALDRYIAAGIFDDHECSYIEEAKERIRKGQWVMVRQGTAARNLEELLPLFDEPYNRRILLVTDDKHPADLLQSGHIDSILRMAVQHGKSPIVGIRAATLQAAQRFGLEGVGAVAPGYRADVLVLRDLDTLDVCDVYRAGEKVVENGKTVEFSAPYVDQDIWKTVRNSFYLDPLTEENFHVTPQNAPARVICMVPGQLLTEEEQLTLHFAKNNGVDVQQDICKLAVIERHVNSGHMGLGYIRGMGLQRGAIASSVAHDSHNLIVAGTNERDMAAAANAVREMGGGLVVVNAGKVLAEMPLPIGGLMSKLPAKEVAQQNEKVREAVHTYLSVPRTSEPFMSLAFVSLPVIPSIKMTTQGLVDVNAQKRLPLFVTED